MSVNELQALAKQFADAFDQRDLKTFLGMLSDDLEVFDHVPYRFDGKPLFAKYLNGGECDVKVFGDFATGSDIGMDPR